MNKWLWKLSELPLTGLNAFYGLAAGGDRRKVFFDIDQTMPELRAIDRKYPEIRRELMDILPGKDSIPKYHELDQGQTGISAGTDHDWKVFMIYAMGEKPDVNRSLCPETSAVLDTVPDLFQAFFSILDAGKSVPAHCGPYRGYLRYHLGLKVPKDNPPSIRIKDQHYTWKEGESVLFDDSWNHEVYNNSSQDRVVLIVDVLRPMPLVFSMVNRIVTFFIRRIYAKSIAQKLR